MGAMLTYGSYLDKDTNISVSSLEIAFLDTFCAIIAGAPQRNRSRRPVENLTIILNLLIPSVGRTVQSCQVLWMADTGMAVDAGLAAIGQVFMELLRFCRLHRQQHPVFVMAVAAFL